MDQNGRIRVFQNNSVHFNKCGFHSYWVRGGHIFPLVDMEVLKGVLEFIIFPMLPCLGTQSDLEGSFNRVAIILAMLHISDVVVPKGQRMPNLLWEVLAALAVPRNLCGFELMHLADHNYKRYFFEENHPQKIWDYGLLWAFWVDEPLGSLGHGVGDVVGVDKMVLDVLFIHLRDRVISGVYVGFVGYLGPSSCSLEPLIVFMDKLLREIDASIFLKICLL